MNQKITVIDTEVGIITGRDAIYCHHVKVLSEAEFCITGELMGNNCSKTADNIEVKFSITFSGVLLFKMLELDFDNIKYESCFDSIEDSEILANLRARDKAAHIGKIDRGYDAQGKFSYAVFHQHFVFRTYDSVLKLSHSTMILI